MSLGVFVVSKGQHAAREKHILAQPASDDRVNHTREEAQAAFQTSTSRLPPQISNAASVKSRVTSELDQAAHLQGEKT